MKREEPSSQPPEHGGTLSSCLEKVIMTFILLLTTITLIGAGLSSGGNDTGECAVSDRFPREVLRWCGLITANARETGLPPDLIAALIWQESGGNPRAYSHSGAVGLMQVMPRDGLAEKFVCPEGPCFQDRPYMHELRDPEFNIRYGTRMLKSLVDKHGGNMREALKYYGPIDVGYHYADTVIALYQRYGKQ